MVQFDKAEIARRSQDLRAIYALNGAVYVARTEWLIKHRSFFSSQTLGYLMPEDRSLDLDTPYDWKVAEGLISSDASLQVPQRSV